MNAIKYQPKTPKKMDKRKNNHRKIKVTTKQEKICIKHNHQLKIIQRIHANEEPQSSGQKRPKHQETNSTHIYRWKQRKKKSYIREGENRNQPQKNQSSSLRQEIIVQAHKTYTKENTIQNMAKWKATRNATSDEKQNEMSEQREKKRLHKINKLWNTNERDQTPTQKPKKRIKGRIIIGRPKLPRSRKTHD